MTDTYVSVEMSVTCAEIIMFPSCNSQHYHLYSADYTMIRSPIYECPEFKPLSYWQRHTYMLTVTTSFNILYFFHLYLQNWSQTKPLKLHKMKKL